MLREIGMRIRFAKNKLTNLVFAFVFAVLFAVGGYYLVYTFYFNHFSELLSHHGGSYDEFLCLNISYTYALRALYSLNRSIVYLKQSVVELNNTVANFFRYEDSFAQKALQLLNKTLQSLDIDSLHRAYSMLHNCLYPYDAIKREAEKYALPAATAFTPVFGLFGFAIGYILGKETGNSL